MTYLTCPDGVEAVEEEIPDLDAVPEVEPEAAGAFPAAHIEC